MYTDISLPVLFSNNVKCSYIVCKYTRMSSRKTATLESNISENRLFMVYMNVAGAFISSMGITIHL